MSIRSDCIIIIEFQKNNKVKDILKEFILLNIDEPDIIYVLKELYKTNTFVWKKNNIAFCALFEFIRMEYINESFNELIDYCKSHKLIFNYEFKSICTEFIDNSYILEHDQKSNENNDDILGINITFNNIPEVDENINLKDYILN